MSKLEPTQAERLALKLGKEDKLESWCTWHLNDDDSGENTAVNQQQVARLMGNIADKLEELVKTAVCAHLGRFPDQREVTKKLDSIKYEDRPHEIWWFWDRMPILFTTEPKSRIEENDGGDVHEGSTGGRYYLTWFAKILVENKNN